jgi:uncharacterized protein YecE (DUF72 family)
MVGISWPPFLWNPDDAAALATPVKWLMLEGSRASLSEGCFSPRQREGPEFLLSTFLAISRLGQTKPSPGAAKVMQGVPGLGLKEPVVPELRKRRDPAHLDSDFGRYLSYTNPNKGENMKIFVGTSGFGYKQWKGKFYPDKISPQEMLRFYSRRFAAVEINNTFYHMPTEPVLTSWAEQVPDYFVFALKAPQVITHLKRLRNVGEETGYFFRMLSVLEKKLGPVLFQFPKSFRGNRPALENFLALIPGSISCAFDFRSPSWLDSEILDLLRGKGCSLCTTDADENPPDEIIKTAPWGYLRLRRSAYTDADLSKWLERILAQKWEKAFIFFKHEEEAKGPEMARRFRELADLR